MPYPQSVLDIAARINNWGRWGDDDQIGTLNFLNIAAVATDNIVFEVLPYDPAFEGAIIAIHCLDLVDMGLTQGQNWDMEELAADCAADGQYDFFLEASPQPFVGGLGSPVNPVAIK